MKLVECWWGGAVPHVCQAYLARCSAASLRVRPAQCCEPESWGAGRRSESAAANQHDAIKAFVQGTVAEAAPVVPISAQLKYNIDAVCEYIIKKVAAHAFVRFFVPAACQRAPEHCMPGAMPSCASLCPQPASEPWSIALFPQPAYARLETISVLALGTNRDVDRRCRCRCATLCRRRR